MVAATFIVKLTRVLVLAALSSSVPLFVAAADLHLSDIQGTWNNLASGENLQVDGSTTFDSRLGQGRVSETIEHAANFVFVYQPDVHCWYFVTLLASQPPTINLANRDGSQPNDTCPVGEYTRVDVGDHASSSSSTSSSSSPPPLSSSEESSALPPADQQSSRAPQPSSPAILPPSGPPNQGANNPPPVPAGTRAPVDVVEKIKSMLGFYIPLGATDLREVTDVLPNANITWLTDHNSTLHVFTVNHAVVGQAGFWKLSKNDPSDGMAVTAYIDLLFYYNMLMGVSFTTTYDRDTRNGDSNSDCGHWGAHLDDYANIYFDVSKSSTQWAYTIVDGKVVIGWQAWPLDNTNQCREALTYAFKDYIAK